MFSIGYAKISLKRITSVVDASALNTEEGKGFMISWITGSNFSASESMVKVLTPPVSEPVFLPPKYIRPTKTKKPNAKTTAAVVKFGILIWKINFRIIEIIIIGNMFYILE